MEDTSGSVDRDEDRDIDSRDFQKYQVRIVAKMIKFSIFQFDVFTHDYRENGVASHCDPEGSFFLTFFRKVKFVFLEIISLFLDKENEFLNF